MRCGVVVDYSGSMPRVVRDVFRSVYQSACLPVHCDVFSGAVIPHYKGGLRDYDFLVRDILEVLNRQSPHGESLILQYIGEVLKLLGSNEVVDEKRIFLLLFSDLQQDVRFRFKERVPSGIEELRMLIILFRGKEDPLHSVDVFASGLASMFSDLLNATISFENEVGLAAKEMLGGGINSKEIVNGRVTLVIASSESLMTADDPCEFIDNIMRK